MSGIGVVLLLAGILGVGIGVVTGSVPALALWIIDAKPINVLIVDRGQRRPARPLLPPVRAKPIGMP